MKSLKEKAAMALVAANARYSALWISATGEDKWAYREKSVIHSALISAAYALLRNERKAG